MFHPLNLALLSYVPIHTLVFRGVFILELCLGAENKLYSKPAIFSVVVRLF